MKTKKMLLIMLFYPFFAFGQIWDYPVKPGTDGWACIISSEEQLNLVQIPNDILARISTDELAKLCLKYPLFFEYTAFNDERMAISLMIKKFNGLRELSEREDGTIALMKIYDQMKIQEKEGYVEKGEYSSVLHFEYMELLLSSDVFINQLSVEKQKELRKMTVVKYGKKLEHIDIYGLSGIKTSLLLSSVIINIVNPDNKNSQLLKDFISNYNSADNIQLETISMMNTQTDE